MTANYFSWGRRPGGLPYIPTGVVAPEISGASLSAPGSETTPPHEPPPVAPQSTSEPAPQNVGGDLLGLFDSFLNGGDDPNNPAYMVGGRRVIDAGDLEHFFNTDEGKAALFGLLGQDFLAERATARSQQLAEEKRQRIADNFNRASGLLTQARQVDASLPAGASKPFQMPNGPSAQAFRQRLAQTRATNHNRMAQHRADATQTAATANQALTPQAQPQGAN